VVLERELEPVPAGLAAGTPVGLLAPVSLPLRRSRTPELEEAAELGPSTEIDDHMGAVLGIVVLREEDSHDTESEPGVAVVWEEGVEAEVEPALQQEQD